MHRQRNIRRKPDAYRTPLWVLLALGAIITIIWLIGRMPERKPEETPSPSVPDTSASAPPVGTSTQLPGETPGPSPGESMSISGHSVDAGPLILVNGAHPYSFSMDAALVPLSNYKTEAFKVSGNDILVNEASGPLLAAMLDDFHAATGIGDVIVVSAYRSYEFQQEMMENRVEELGEEDASTLVAPPGASEHHTGLCVDFAIYTDGEEGIAFMGQDAYGWLNDHCHRYGFVVRYAADKQEITHTREEPWHFRYVGIPHAAVMVENNWCLEEYMDVLTEATLEAPLRFSDEAGTDYVIYSVGQEETADGIAVPKGAEVAISGNNAGRFIITCTL